MEILNESCMQNFQRKRSFLGKDLLSLKKKNLTIVSACFISLLKEKLLWKGKNIYFCFEIGSHSRVQAGLKLSMQSRLALSSQQPYKC